MTKRSAAPRRPAAARGGAASKPNQRTRAAREGTPPEPRKAPRQQRSMVTVDAIVEAATRILRTEPRENFNTNRIADVAGVSVGSLYQYFPNKQALLIAVAERCSQFSLADTLGVMNRFAGLPLRETIAGCIGAIFAEFNSSPQLYREMVQALFAMGVSSVPEVRQATMAAIAAALERSREQVLPRDAQAAAFCIVVTLATVVQTAWLQAPEMIADGRLERELTAMITRYLLGEAVQSGG